MARTKRKVNPLLPPAAPAEASRRVYQAGGYVRLSVEDGGRPGADTMETQRELIRSYIAGQPDMRLYDLYCDNGRTGTNFDRPEFVRMMEDVRRGKIDCIVVKDLSRFGRDYRETGKYLEGVFPLLGVRFVAINDHFDTLTAERSQDGYIVPLKNIMNAVYSKDIGRKSRSALLTKQKNGDFIGNWAAYGYRKCAGNRHRIEPDEETAPVVRDIFQWRLSGLSCQNIARKLNERGIPSPARHHYLNGEARSEYYAKTLWSAGTVKIILKNEVYLGHMIQGRRRSGFSEGRRRYPVPESEWAVVRNTHEPLIDEDTFRTVQQMAEAASQTYQERLGRHDGLGSVPNILRGLVCCADCRRTLTRVKNVTNKGTHLYYTYICRTHSDDPLSCPKKNLHETELKEILWDTLQREIALAADSGRCVGQDSLYQSYADKLMPEQRQKELRRRTGEHPQLTTCGRHRQETELTETLAHALIERVEIDAENHISITLRYRDEYRDLLQRLEAGGEAVLA